MVPPWANIRRLQIHGEYLRLGNFTDIEGLSQGLSDCILHNDKYTKNLSIQNYRFRALIGNLVGLFLFGISR
jgi:hypothetical protein